eukprot:6470678-Amphidinium_carterae.1
MLQLHRRNLLRSETGRRLSRHTVMRIHGEHWSALSAEDKQAYNNWAATKRAEREIEIETAIEEEHATLALESERGSVVERETQSMMMRSAALGESEKAMWEKLLAHEMWTNSRVKDLRTRSDTCPEPVPAQRYEALSAKGAHIEAHRRPASRFVLDVAGARDHLKDAVLIIGEDGGERAYKFVMAIQRNPID